MYHLRLSRVYLYLLLPALSFRAERTLSVRRGGPFVYYPSDLEIEQ